MKQGVANAKKVAANVLKIISEIQQNHLMKRQSLHLYAHAPIHPLRRNYSNITVIFGPGLGLGDQITFLQFLRNVAQHCRGARMTIFTLYPNLWRNIIPHARELDYRGRPLRPILYLEKNRLAKTEKGRELVLIADFECFNFHKNVIPHHPNRDILEIALGRRAIWSNPGDSSWIRFEAFSNSQKFNNNYSILAQMAKRLIPESTDISAWKPIKPVKSQLVSRKEKIIFLNPFTSKEFFLTPHDWYRILQTAVEKLLNITSLRIVIFPGLSESCRNYASEIVHLCAKGPGSINAHLLEGINTSLLTPYSAIPIIIQLLKEVDLCITVDTFTAHLVPLFSVPTLVVTDRENKSFWVPCSWSFYCLIDRMQRDLPTLINYLLTAALQAPAFSSQATKTAEKIVDVTMCAIERGIGIQEINKFQEGMARFLGQVGGDFAYRGQANKWLLIWSRLSLANRNDPVESGALQPYLNNWLESDLFKILSFNVEK
ncbi:MAG: hypothetical protein IH948_00535 [Bacteroidetes bacterium]|nr:hypothetical protein [Bacteroidota bacterium]